VHDQHDEHQDQKHCRYCDRPIVLDGNGLWVHVRGSYPCHDDAGVALTGRFATPPKPWPAIKGVDPPTMPVISNGAIGRAAVPPGRTT
jgi:hypothetical protein